ncbi:ankyrin repeat-containing domain protein [Xylogone sp. PMI_703]|nr:ankyrin repeat-containing domain protein [Xylogone sp. PMI_703]
MDKLPLESLVEIAQHIDHLSLYHWLLTSKHYHSALIKTLYDKTVASDKETGWPRYLARATLLNRVTISFKTLLDKTSLEDINKSNIIIEDSIPEKTRELLEPARPTVRPDPTSPRPTTSILHIACQLCSENIVKLVLLKGVNPSLIDGFKWTPLHLVAWSGRIAIIRLLVDAGASIDAMIGWGEAMRIAMTHSNTTPFHQAVSQGHIPAIEVLLQAGADPKAKYRFRRDALGLASSIGRVNVMWRLLNIGCYNKDSIDTALTFATGLKDILPTKLLLDAGADPQRGIVDAVWKNRPENLKILLDAGADPRGNLHMISGIRSLQIAKLLSSSVPGFSIIRRHPQKFRMTPLSTLYMKYHDMDNLEELEEIILLLIEDGCPIRGVEPESDESAGDDRQDWNILNGAATCGHLRVIKTVIAKEKSLVNWMDGSGLLIENGANIYAICIETTILGSLYQSSLHAALNLHAVEAPYFTLQNAEMTRYLINEGIDINEYSNRQPSLISALETGNDPSAVILINAGADIYFKSIYKPSTLHTAAQHGCAESMERLLQVENVESLLEHKDGYTLLHSAVHGGLTYYRDVKGYARVMGLILLGHTDISVEGITDEESATLEALSHTGGLEVIRRLCDKGIVDPGARIYGEGMTPFDLIRTKENEHVLNDGRRARQIAEVADLEEEADRKWPKSLSPRS